MAFTLADWAVAQSTRPGWGATPYADSTGTGVTFRVWAPNATSIHVFGNFNSWNTNNLPLVKEVPLTNGVWSLDVPAARPGHEFKYSINNSIRRRDPRVRQVLHSGVAPGVIYDANAYAWNSPGFIPPPIEDITIYEMHIGAFGGDFYGAASRLDHVAALGANAIKLMPVAEFAGDNSWGYNPSDPFAVETSYGGPDGLKHFVDACHQRGIAVILDVVHNHYGPDDLGNSLWNFDGWADAQGGGIYFYQDAVKAQTQWGPRPDYSRPQVRQYIIDNMRMWMDEYRIDGFRWDATKYIRFATNGTDIAEGVALLREVADMMAHEYPEKYHIAEDHVGDGRITAPLSNPNGLGFQSEWSAAFHHVITRETTNDAARNIDAIAGQLRYTGGVSRIHYVESHDEVGDHNEESGAIRFPAEISATQPSGYIARKKSTLAATLMMTAPGIPMLFQGQEMMEDQLFSDATPVDWTKTNTYAGIVRLYRDLDNLRKNLHGVSGGLAGSGFAHVTVTNNGTLLLMHRGVEGRPEDDMYVIANFSSNKVEGYWIDFPTAADGTWYTHFNSDSLEYSDDYEGWGSETIFVWPDWRGDPLVAPWSVLVLSRHAPGPVDTDRDGIPDDWEIANGLDPANPHDAWLNPDRDAYSNLQEYRANTDPNVWNEPASAYDYMVLTGTFVSWETTSNRMARIADGLWQLDYHLTGPVEQFKFVANGTWDANWGLVAGTQPRFHTPMTMNAVNGYEDITLSNITAGIYRFRFNENTLQFTVRPVARADSDMDGLPDDWEILYGMDPLSTLGAYDNPDGDLYDNQEEFRRGLNPIVWNPPLTSFITMAIVGNMNNWGLPGWHMSQDPSNHYQWVLTTNFVQTTGITFKIAANDAFTYDWGGNANVAFGLPMAHVTTYKGNWNLAVTQTFHGTYRFTFNEQTRLATVTSLDTDTDGDGIPDWWEILHFGCATCADPLGDPDGDGLTNLQEYLGNTNPHVYDIPAANYATMAVAGSFNGWNTTANMSLVGPHTWRYSVAINASNPEFKFAANGGWGTNWGHNASAALPLSGTSWFDGPNIRISGTVNGTVVFTFNDDTLQYTVAYNSVPPAFTGGGFAGGNPASGMVIQWESTAGETYQIHRGTNLMAPFTVVAPLINATPPMNRYTDSVQNATAVFYGIGVN